MPKKKLNWDCVHVCSKCGKKEKIHDYRRMVKRMVEIAKEPIPDPELQFLCTDCSIELSGETRMRFQHPDVTNYLVSCKLDEVGIPPTDRNIEWYKKALTDTKKEYEKESE